MSDVPDGFRETPLGPLPETWDVVKVGDVISETISGDWGSGDKDGREAWIRCQVIRGTDFPSVAAGEFSSVPERYVRPSSVEKRRLRVDDMLVEISGGSKYQPTGRILCITPRISSSARLPLLFTNFVKLFRIDQSSVAPSFFHLVWRYLYELGRTCIYEKRTTGIRNFRYGDFVASEYIPLPPLAEQRAIAHVLRTVQRAREATDGVIAAVRELKRSLMRHLFTYGPVPVHEAERVELQETEIGPIPAHWEMVRLGDAIEEGPQNGMYKPQSLYGRGTPIVRIDDYENEGSVVTRARNRVQLSEAEVSKYGLRLNDILVNRVNSLSHLGKTALIGPLVEPMVFESNMIRFRVNQRLADPEYVFRFLCAPVCRDQMRGMAKRAVAQSSINQGDVKSIALPRPPLAEQRQVTHILSMVDAKIAAEEARREALDGLFHSLLHHLMTGRIRTQGFQRQDAKTQRRKEDNKMLGASAP